MITTKDHATISRLTQLGSNTSAPQNLTTPLAFDNFPEEVVLHILGYLSAASVCKLSLVSKKLSISTGQDVLWKKLAKPLLFNHDVEVKQNTPYKDYYRDLVCPSNLYKISEKDFHTLKPRSTALADKIKQMNPSQFYLLNPKEAQMLLQQKETFQLIKASAKNLPERLSSFDFEHISQQKIGKIQFDIFNCTEHLISFDEQRTFLINNKPTARTFTKHDCQLLICTSKKYFHVFHSDLGANKILDMYCSLPELALDDPKKIKWWRSIDRRKQMIVKNQAIEVKKIVLIYPEDSKPSPIVDFINQMHLPNFRFLTHNEAYSLLENELTANALIHIFHHFKWSNVFRFLYVSQQKIGNYQIDTFNSTYMAISINADGTIFFNNQALLNFQSEVLKLPAEGHYQFFTTFSGGCILYKKVDDPFLVQLEKIVGSEGTRYDKWLFNIPDILKIAQEGHYQYFTTSPGMGIWYKRIEDPLPVRFETIGENEWHVKSIHTIEDNSITPINNGKN